jgi:hypothetical protein
MQPISCFVRQGKCTLSMLAEPSIKVIDNKYGDTGDLIHAVYFTINECLLDVYPYC